LSSIKLDNNGDIVLDSLGKIILIEDMDALAQSLNLRLKTQKGELFYNEDYGHPKFIGKQNEKTILDYLKDALMDDERIIDVEIASLSKDSFGRYKVDAEIKLNNYEVLDLDFTL
jgi:hypothetical protein